MPSAQVVHDPRTAMIATRIAASVPIRRNLTMDKKAKTPKKPKTATPKSPKAS
jgi:hypothetical protein